jgi:hypothetical protein
VHPVFRAIDHDLACPAGPSLLADEVLRSAATVMDHAAALQQAA